MKEEYPLDLVGIKLDSLSWELVIQVVKEKAFQGLLSTQETVEMLDQIRCSRNT